MKRGLLLMGFVRLRSTVVRSVHSKPSSISTNELEQAAQRAISICLKRITVPLLLNMSRHHGHTRTRRQTFFLGCFSFIRMKPHLFQHFLKLAVQVDLPLGTIAFGHVDSATNCTLPASCPHSQCRRRRRCPPSCRASSSCCRSGRTRLRSRRGLEGRRSSPLA